MKKIQVMVCDDHEILRKGMTQLLKLQNDFEVIGEATNGKEAVQQINQLNPDIVLMDINMPKLNGIETTALIRKSNQTVKIIMLTISDDDEDLFKAIKSGANGYLLKNMNLEELFVNMRRVYEGTPTFSPSLATKILEQFAVNNRQSQQKVEYNLSQREKQILELVALGKTNQHIADTLFLSIHTVKKHIQHILEKLHVNNRAEATSFALRRGLLNDDVPEQNTEYESSFFNW